MTMIAGLFSLGLWPTLLVVAIVAAGSFFLKANRTKALAAFAPGVNFAFQGGSFQPGNGPFAPLSVFPVFNEGSARTITNVLHGQVDDAQVQIFDYSYTLKDFQSGSDVTHRSTNSYRSFTAVAFTSSGATVFPTLQLFPRTFFSGLGESGINLPQFPEFSKRFVLQSPDENAVRAMFDQPTAAFFETYYDVTVCASGPALVFYRPGKIVSVAEARQFLDLGVIIYRTLGAAAARMRH